MLLKLIAVGFRYLFLGLLFLLFTVEQPGSANKGSISGARGPGTCNGAATGCTTDKIPVGKANSGSDSDRGYFLKNLYSHTIFVP